MKLHNWLRSNFILPLFLMFGIFSSCSYTPPSTHTLSLHKNETASHIIGSHSLSLLSEPLSDEKKEKSIEMLNFSYLKGYQSKNISVGGGVLSTNPFLYVSLMYPNIVSFSPFGVYVFNAKNTFWWFLFVK